MPALPRQAQVYGLRHRAGRIARNQELEGLGDDGKFDGQTGKRLAVHLGIDRVGVERLTDERFGFPEVDIFFLAEIAHPERGEIAEITQAALRGESHALELVFEEVSLIGDLERAAVMLCAANDDKCRLHLAVSGTHAEARKGIANDFASALPPVGENADARLQTEIDGIDDHAVGAGAGDGEEIALAGGIFEGCGEAESDVVEVGVDEAPGSARNVPRKIEFFGEDVGGATREESERNTIAVRGSGQAVDDFVERAIAATGDDELTMLPDSLLGDLDSVTRPRGFREFGFDAVGGQDAAGLVEKFATAVAAVSGVGIMNEKCVLKR